MKRTHKQGEERRDDNKEGLDRIAQGGKIILLLCILNRKMDGEDHEDDFDFKSMLSTFDDPNGLTLDLLSPPPPQPAVSLSGGGGGIQT